MKPVNYILGVLFCFCLGAINGQQQKYTLNVLQTDTPILKTIEKKRYDCTVKDSLGMTEALRDFVFMLRADGYISCGIDSVKYDSLEITAFLHAGKKYQWKILRFSDETAEMLKRNGVKTKQFQRQAVDFRKIKTARKKLITWYENNGHPFAVVKLDSIMIDGNQISGSFRVEKRDFITIDSIVVKGDAKISGSYLRGCLDIEPEDAYSEKKIRNISPYLKSLPFLKQKKPWDIRFREDKADIYLYLDKKKASQFNGIIGFLPNNKTTGKLLLTGELSLFLQNSFGKGEIINFEWEKLQTSSQKLNALFEYPYLFGFPFGIEAQIDLYRQDTSFITVKTHAGIQYLMSGNNYVKGYIENKTSSIISTTGLENTLTPPYLDVNTTLYGLGVKYEKLDYKFNPRKGIALRANLAAGTKKIEKNANLLPEVYEDLDLQTNQAEGDLEFSRYFPIGRHSAVKLKNLSAFMYSSTLFENELFRIGGLKTLRGFDEEAILASAYSVFTVEYRFLFEENSALYAFFDAAWYEKYVKTGYVEDMPIGFGAGLDFQTQAGIFTVSYALGKQFNNPIEIRSAKIHFGFVNRF